MLSKTILSFSSSQFLLKSALSIFNVSTETSFTVLSDDKPQPKSSIATVKPSFRIPSTNSSSSSVVLSTIADSVISTSIILWSIEYLSTILHNVHTKFSSLICFLEKLTETLTQGILRFFCSLKAIQTSSNIYQSSSHMASDFSNCGI